MSNSSIHQSQEVIEDIDLDDIDPEATWDAFVAAWRRFEKGGKWSHVKSTLGTFLRSLTPNEQRRMWRAKKAIQRSGDESSLLWVLVLYERERNRRRSQTKKGKARMARADAKRANEPTRQAKVREYKARHRAKIKAKNTAEKPTLRIVK